MMRHFDALGAFNALTDSDALDHLLREAKTATASSGLSDASDVTSPLATLDQRVSRVQDQVSKIADDLRDEIQKRAALREQKVALVEHMLGLAKRLCPC